MFTKLILFTPIFLFSSFSFSSSQINLDCSVEQSSLGTGKIERKLHSKDGRVITCRVGSFIILLPELQNPKAIAIQSEGKVPYLTVFESGNVYTSSNTNGYVSLLRDLLNEGRFSYLSYEIDNNGRKIKVTDWNLNGIVDEVVTRDGSVASHKMLVDDQMYEIIRRDNKVFINYKGEEKRIKFSKDTRKFELVK